MIFSLVILTFALSIAAGLVVERLRARRGPVRPPAPRPGKARVEDLLLPSLQSRRFVLPGGLFFHRGHTWANLLFSGQVKVGADDFLQRLLGHVDAVTLPPLGAEVKQGQPLATIRQGGRTATLTAPVDGVVCAVNGELAKAPGLLKRDPYTRGWLVALQPTNLAANLPGLAVGESALVWLKAELARLQEFLHATQTLKQDALVGVTAADGGLVADGLLEHLDDEAWAEFQSRFLSA
ncbi:MAG: glycine cleavage system protein H [candidate division NC10 bacterium]|nr:glycine cleavage system protein H [candidate division NC10 bacterium]